jgi:hypothetical protein
VKDIDELEDIPIGNTVQSIRTRGADTSNPVLLLVLRGRAHGPEQGARVVRTLGAHAAVRGAYGVSGAPHASARGGDDGSDTIRTDTIRTDPIRTDPIRTDPIPSQPRSDS